MTALKRIQRNRVFVKVNVFIHVKADCPEILCLGSLNPKT